MFLIIKVQVGIDKFIKKKYILQYFLYLRFDIVELYIKIDDGSYYY